LVILSVIACFSGFLFYLFMNIISNFLCLIGICIKIFRLKIPSKVESHNNDINRYKEELDAIGAKLRQENLADAITMQADNIATHE